MERFKYLKEWKSNRLLSKMMLMKTDGKISLNRIINLIVLFGILGLFLINIETRADLETVEDDNILRGASWDEIIARTPVYDDYIISGKRTLDIVGQRSFDNDKKKWISITELPSLKNIEGINYEIISDGKNLIDVIDFNYTDIILNVSISDKLNIVSKDIKIPIKTYDKENKEKELKQELSFKTLKDSSLINIKYSFGEDIIHIGENSTILNITGTTLTMCGYNDTYDEINIINSGILYVCAYNGTVGTGELSLQVTNLYIENGSVINGNARGYRSRTYTDGEGPGGAIYDSSIKISIRETDLGIIITILKGMFKGERMSLFGMMIPTILFPVSLLVLVVGIIILTNLLRKK